jgi:hypothetical protein
LETYQLFKVFLSSPDDVRQERAIAEDVIGQVNKSCRDTLGLQADAHTWKHLPPLTPRMSESTIQQLINEEVRECNVFVLILYKRYGSVEPGHNKSNTEREIDVALDMLATGRKIMFMSYFRELPPNADQGEQEEKVRRLRESLRARGVLFHTYQTAEEFKERFTHDLYHTILKFRISTTKQRALRAFWQFGVPEGATSPRLALAYPPVGRYFMRQESPDQVWLRRLVPHIVFEDFKALQKVEKTLRLIGFRDFESFNVATTPPDLQDRNRLWLCLPRSQAAQHQLDLYQDRAQFRFKRSQPEGEVRIHWRPSPTRSRIIEVRSPLAKYLNLQRSDDPGGEWKGRHGQIFAKDFAVLARFADQRERVPMSSGTLKDFFIAGIRGLGTWGAGWFIDRRHNALSACCNGDDSDVQILLEITYRHEQIHDVRVVSNEPEKYFRSENRLNVIRARIKENR